jgi:hypothetical protein
MKKQALKTYSLDEITDKHIGKRGTPKREAFENELRLDLIGETIKTEEDYTKALKRLEEIFHASPNTKEGDEAEILSILIEKYEDEHYPI